MTSGGRKGKWGVWCTPPKGDRRRAGWLKDFSTNKRGVVCDYFTREQAQRDRDACLRQNPEEWSYSIRRLA